MLILLSTIMLHHIGNKLRPLLNEQAVRHIKQAFPDAKSIADVGCGDGQLGRLLGADLYDINPQASDITKHNILEPLPKRYELVVCSNVLEHIDYINTMLLGLRLSTINLWLSFTPWLSPFGGHEFSPLHYLGKTKGSIHQLGHNLFRTNTKTVLVIMARQNWDVIRVQSRYFNHQILNDTLLWNTEIWAR